MAEKAKVIDMETVKDEETGQEKAVPKEGFFKRIGRKIGGFPKKHPKITKVVKIGGNIVAGVAAVGGVIFMIVRSLSDGSEEVYQIPADSTEALEDHIQDLVDTNEAVSVEEPATEEEAE